MSISIKDNNLLDVYKNYFNQDDLTLNDFANIKRNQILSSMISEIDSINIKKNDISEKEIDSIYYILVKISFIARIDLVMAMNSIKSRDRAFSRNIRYSRDIIDYVLRVIIKLLIRMDDEHIGLYYNNKFINNDSISHSNRVFIMLIRFMKYYNNSIDNNIVSEIRRNFKKKYAKYYKEVLYKFNINKKISKLEHVYKYGLRDVLFNEIINAAIAAFWHDISNLFNTYNTEYNTVKCYSYLKHFICYSYDVSLTVGLHNEYYGYGNGVFLNYYNTISNSKTFSSPNYIISFDYNDTLRLNSLSYFPSKVLEIIDLFDMLNYSKNNGNNNVLLFMKENYLDREVKIDPIIFDIFNSFINENEKLLIA